MNLHNIEEIKIEIDAYAKIAEGFETLTKLGRWDPFDITTPCKVKASFYRSLHGFMEQKLNDLLTGVGS